MPEYLKSPYINYKYPHNYASSIVKQVYLPKNLVNSKYYIPKLTSKYESVLAETKKKIDDFQSEGK